MPDCPVCLEAYSLPARDPKVLNCGHTFCSVCLEQVSHAGQFRCPTCRVETSHNAIRVNFALREVLEADAASTARGNIAVANSPPAIHPEPLPPLVPEDSEVHVHLYNATVPGGIDDGGLLVSLEPPVGSTRTPCDLCCVVDVSQSMDALAMVQNEVGEYMQHGLTQLDVVKHALKAVIRILDGKDRLSIVIFSDMAQTVLELTPMTAEGQRRAELRVHQLLARGNTNLWTGLETGIKQFHQNMEADAPQQRSQHLLLLTDGIPNIQPPRGIVPMLRHYKNTHGLRCTLNTFGFGYELDSPMLADIAALGCGSYAFIPDAGFVGTVFVNAVSNLLATMATHVQLMLTQDTGTTPLTIGSVRGGITVKAIGGGLVVDLEPLQFGQSKDLFVQLPSATSPVHAQLKYRLRDGITEQVETSATVSELQPPPGGSEFQFSRVAFIDGVQQAMKVMTLTNLDKLQKVTLVSRIPEAQEQVRVLSDRIISMLGQRSASPEIEALLEDISGQVAEAFSRVDWYEKWGSHFLRSLVNAHNAQQCNNFKDPGVQHYGGDLFKTLRDDADIIFLSLEVPRPHERPTRPPPPLAAPGAVAAPVIRAPPPVVRAAPLMDMSAYYSASAG